ncbi:hypothetical protein L1887_47939 [Cichorium endivia]|nr:hypothetical protein L1887_47939 [Cichorium endivia]
MTFSMRPSFGRQTTIDATSSAEATQPGVTMQSVAVDGNETKNAATVTSGSGTPSNNGDEVPDSDAQAGVKSAQAITLSWSKASLLTTLCCIWFYTLSGGFRVSIQATMAPYATSAWSQHTLLTVIETVASALTGACYIPLAKLLDLWGRAEGFMLMVCMLSLGLVLQAAASNLPTYCAGRCRSVRRRLRACNRLDRCFEPSQSLALLSHSHPPPYMITAFAGPRAAESFQVDVGNWRWAFGAFAIITPFVALPLYTVLKVNLNKAKKSGLVSKTSVSSGKNIHRDPEFIGVILFGGGLVVFLLPFNLAASAPNGWSTGYIIAMIIIGFAAIVAFCFHELYWASSPWMPWHFLTDRSMIGTCALNFVYQISYYTWNIYFQSFLQVVFNVSIAEAGYINNTFSVVSGFLLFLVGWAIRRTGYYRWLFYIAVPLYTFTLGLMIHFRQPNGNIGYIIMCEIFISIGGACFILICQLSVLASVDHQHASSAMSLLYVSGSVGGAIGPTISGAIWTNLFPKALMRYLPAAEQPNAALIMGSLTQQLSYPVGSEERFAIQHAYGYAHSRMLAAGVAFSALMFIFMFMIKNVNVKNSKQTKGMVF